MTDRAVATAVLVPPRQRLSADERRMRGLTAAAGLWLVVALLLPLYTLLSRSLRAAGGEFVGLVNYVQYFATPALVESIQNSLFVASLSTAICLGLSFPYAYALTRSAIPGKGCFKSVALIPLLAPSLLAAISVRYLFGNQGLLNWMLGGHSVYGPIGIVIGEVFHAFPFALLILTTALGTADSRLYDAALTLRASKVRIFFTVTLPGIKYGLVTATFVVFTLVITDFGIPKITGGRFNVLATDIYKQVVGQNNLEMGAVVGVVLLIPAVVAFVVERLVQRRQLATLTAGIVPYEPRPAPRFDTIMFLFCSLVALMMLGMLAVSVFASLITYWPYNLQFTLANYDFDRVDDQGWGAYANSLRMAGWTMLFGTVVVFVAAYLVEKTRGWTLVRGAIHFLSIVPLAVPGLVLGIAYVVFFVDLQNPLHFLFRTMAILVISTIVHYYPVSHLIAVTALKQMDREFEAIAASLQAPTHRTFWRVTVPVCLPAILDISVFFFVNAMTTTSAVVFLYGPDTLLASVAILNMDETGAIANAAAMSVLIVATSTAMRVVHWLVVRRLLRRTQAWRAR